MSNSEAVRRYLDGYAEPEARLRLELTGSYQHSLVIPAFRESAANVRHTWDALPAPGTMLVILVVNAPDADDSDAVMLSNDLLAASSTQSIASGIVLSRADDRPDILLVDRYSTNRTIPATEGVGTARKVGLDIALQLHAVGTVASEWLHTTDADVYLPADYFNHEPSPDATAWVHPFIHAPSTNAIRLYEISMLYYTAGLRYAGSPYAYPTVGSTISCRTDAYAKVRGVPKRTTGEDFYLLNKLRKLGTIETPQITPIEISSRLSDRVPVGTGRAVASIQSRGEKFETFAVEHFDCFRELHTLLTWMIEISREQPALITAPSTAIGDWLDHVNFANRYLAKKREDPSPAVMEKFLMDWFDGLKTRQCIHYLRDKFYSSMTVSDIAQSPLAAGMKPGDGWAIRDQLASLIYTSEEKN